jgi:hypothetical protein
MLGSPRRVLLGAIIGAVFGSFCGILGLFIYFGVGGLLHTLSIPSWWIEQVTWTGAGLVAGAATGLIAAAVEPSRSELN